MCAVTAKNVSKSYLKFHVQLLLVFDVIKIVILSDFLVVMWSVEVTTLFCVSKSWDKFTSHKILSLMCMIQLFQFNAK